MATTLQNNYRQHLVKQLQGDIMRMQGFKKRVVSENNKRILPAEIEDHLPLETLQRGVVHEVRSSIEEDHAACTAFITYLARGLSNEGSIFWVTRGQQLYIPGLVPYINPGQLIFARVKNDREGLWVLEQAMRCPGLKCVVGEISELSFAQSRRLQLAAEETQVTGLLHRVRPLRNRVTAAASTWVVKHSPGLTEPEIPGVGQACWQVELERVKNGRPGRWSVVYAADCKLNVLEGSQNMDTDKLKKLA